MGEGPPLIVAVDTVLAEVEGALLAVVSGLYLVAVAADDLLGATNLQLFEEVEENVTMEGHWKVGGFPAEQ